MKQYFSIILLLILIIASCEKDGQENKIASISILYPENESNILCEGCTLQIITTIEIMIAINHLEIILWWFILRKNN